MVELSILIPARNEQFLTLTVANVLAAAETEPEIVVALDGYWPVPALPVHPRVTVLHFPVALGQRAATNRAAQVAAGRYVMKADAHCWFAPGFDRTLLADIQPDWTIVPTMTNLHAFDWVCPQGHHRYQGPSGPCLVEGCGQPTVQELVWKPRAHSPHSHSYTFDTEPHFRYFKEFEKRPEGRGDRNGGLTETMSLQGSCFMLSRQRYFDLNICDESFGSWGSQGIEVAVKSWLSGGRVMCSWKTEYAHLFRTKGGDFGFPYWLPRQQVEFAKSTARELFFRNRWPGQVRPLSWLIEKFWPLTPWWTDEDLQALKAQEQSTWVKPTFASTVSEKCTVAGTPSVSAAAPPVVIAAPATSAESGSAAPAGIVYYTDNRLSRELWATCWAQLQRASHACGLEVLAVSLEPLAFGRNLVLPLTRGYLAMFKQILAGLEALDTEFAFLAEHDVLYHESHFRFVPPRRDRVYYNTNVVKVRLSDGHCLHYDCQQTSGLVADRQLLLAHYRTRVAKTQAQLRALGDSRGFRDFIRRQGFEPGTHGRAERVDDLQSESFASAVANLDLRHDGNLTPSRWRPDEFRNARSCRNWQDMGAVPGWGQIEGRVQEFLKEVAYGLSA